MRAVIQRVSEASVSINGIIKSKIQKGLLVFLGIEENDTAEDIIWLSSKIVRLRIFDDANGVMNVSAQQAGGELLLVSQFTLHASTKKGNRPSYLKAARPDFALLLYEYMVMQLETVLEKKIATGVFQAMMQVALVNDGPVTIIIDSKMKE